MNITVNQDWSRLIPRLLFTSLDGTPIKVILDIQNKDESKIVAKMFERRGGIVTTPSSSSSFTITLAPKLEADKANKKIPIFDVKWIIDCIMSVELLDIDSYLINVDEFGSRRFMDVIYNRSESLDGTLIADEDMSDLYGFIEKEETKKGSLEKYFEIDTLSDDDFYTEIASRAIENAMAQFSESRRKMIKATKEEIEEYNTIMKKKTIQEAPKVAQAKSEDQSETTAQTGTNCREETMEESGNNDDERNNTEEEEIISGSIEEPLGSNVTLDSEQPRESNIFVTSDSEEPCESNVTSSPVNLPTVDTNEKKSQGDFVFKLPLSSRVFKRKFRESLSKNKPASKYSKH